MMETLALPSLALVLILLFWIRRMARQRASAAPSDIRTDNTGVYFTEPRSRRGLAWEEIDKVTLEWEENPWGDPQFGAYCDTDWVLHSKQGLMRIWESSGDANNEVLIPAMQRNLPGFHFSYPTFVLEHKGRVFDLQGGKVTVWERPA